MLFRFTGSIYSSLFHYPWVINIPVRWRLVAIASFISLYNVRHSYHWQCMTCMLNLYAERINFNWFNFSPQPWYGSWLISVSLVRHSLLHFLLSHMAVHHLHHLHYHHLHLLLLAQCFILNSRPSSSANPFLHRPFPLLPDWLHGLSDHLTFLLCSTVVLL